MTMESVVGMNNLYIIKQLLCNDRQGSEKIAVRAIRAGDAADENSVIVSAISVSWYSTAIRRRNISPRTGGSTPIPASLDYCHLRITPHWMRIRISGRIIIR